jgi:hypothetical protein
VDRPLTFSPRELTEYYVARDYERVSVHLLAVLDHFAATPYRDIDLPTRQAIDAFAATSLNLFAQADYTLRPDHALAFIDHNVTISNLVALSSMKTTDPFIEIIQYQENNLAKLLALYSARNKIRLDRGRLFAANPELAARWYVAFGGSVYGGLVEREVHAHLQDHYAYQPALFPASEQVADVYYGCSYVDLAGERPLKEAINRWVRSTLSGCRVRNRPDPKKIAVVSCLWWRGQSSYRALNAYLEALKDHYELTLFYTPMPGRQIETDHFDHVRALRFQNGVLDVDPLLDNDFMVVFFPEIGMTAFSIWLANLRLAPIQVAAQGHYASTWGAEIDYFVSGADAEPDRPERHYSERLVLLPGAGVEHEWPDYTPSGRTKSVPEVVVNCLWSPQKVNDGLCRTLGEVARRSRKPVRFRIFAGDRLNGRLSYGPFLQAVSAQVAPAVVEVPPGMPYRDYMALVEEGDFSVDSYPLGGTTTVLDSLFLKKPVVTREGDRWGNRAGSYLVRRAGQPELVTHSEEEYIERILRLIDDDEYRLKCTRQLQELDAASILWNRQDARYFRKAMDYLIANDEKLKRSADHGPIIIDRD